MQFLRQTPTQAPLDHPFWRTSRSLRGVLAELEGHLGMSPQALALLRELEAMQASLEGEVRERHRRHTLRVIPLQRAAGFP